MAKLDNSMLFRIVLIVLAAFVLFALINYYSSKQNSQKIENFYEEALRKAQESAVAEKPYMSQEPQVKVSGQGQPVGKPQPAEEEFNEIYRSVDYSTQQVPSDCFPKDRLTAEDLLPKDAANNRFSMASPAGQGALSDVNLLSAGSMIGISSVAGTLRNANLQIRSEPPNPQVVVSPWLQSTIAPEGGLRRPLEIGGDC